MDVVSIEALPSIKSVLRTKVSETSVAKENNHDRLCIDENDEDDELRLRFSDDEDIEQDSSAGYIASQQTNLQLNSNDTTLTNKLNYEDLNIKQDLIEEDTVLNRKKYSYLDTHIAEDNIDEGEPNMSGGERGTMQNSPKYWSNNYDRRWKSTQSQGRQSLPQRNSHRNSNDWYNQQYPDKDKYSNRSNYNNHSNHYNKYRNFNARHSYNSQNQQDKKEETSESENSKNNKSNNEDSVEKQQLVQENGISSEIESKENNLSGQNVEKLEENVVNNEKETENPTESSKSKVSIEDSADSNKEKAQSTENQVKDSVIKDSEDHVSESTAKDCDETMTEDKNCELISKNNDSNDISSSVNISSIDYEESTSKDSNNSEVSNDKLDNIPQDNTSDELKNNLGGKNISEKNCEVSNVIKSGDQNSEVEKSDSCKNFVEQAEIDDMCKVDSQTNSSEVESEITENVKSISAEEKSNDTMNVQDEQNNDESSVVDEVNCEKMDVDISPKPCNPLLVIKSIKECNEHGDEQDSTETSSIDSNEDSNQDIPSVRSDTNFMETDESEDIISKKEDEVTDSTESNEQNHIDAQIEEVDLIDDEEVENSNVDNDKITSESYDEAEKNASETFSTEDSSKVEETNEEGRAVVHKRRRRKRNDMIYNLAFNELQTENGVRLKRQSAKNAEELIRKEILKADEEGNSSEGSSTDLLIPVNIRKNVQARSSSPPTLKRPLDDEIENASDLVSTKKIKSLSDDLKTEKKECMPHYEKKEFVPQTKERKEETKDLVRSISQEDVRKKLKRLSQQDMEALLLQKIMECITIRGEMGKLREQAKSSKLSLEASRVKCQQLQKQVEGFDMVLKRINYDKNMNSDKYVPPIKINRSVGLQVNFLNLTNNSLITVESNKLKAKRHISRPDPTYESPPSNSQQTHGVQNPKQAQGPAKNQTSPVANMTHVAKATSATNATIDSNAVSPKKMMKTRSPRRPADVSTPTILHVSNTSMVSGVSPSGVHIINKPQADGVQQVKRTIQLPNAGNILQIVTQPGAQPQQAVVVNSSVGGTVNRPTLTIQRTTANTGAANKSRNDLIDLTDEEDKAKAGTPVTTIARFPRVLQAVPASVALTNSSGIRLVQTNAQGTPINNVNGPKLAYVMQSGPNGPTRQYVLTNPGNQMRPVTSVTRSIPTIGYNKQGITTLPNGQTVRVLSAPSANNLQLARHPAPFPDNPVVEQNPHWKLPPPAPSLKISKVATGIVLSWNMTVNDNYAEICSYQLYAYQEIAGTSPSATLWKKVGDVRALPLPMACTLTQFTAGNKYYFAVRAVDVHSRFGNYSHPGNISL